MPSPTTLRTMQQSTPFNSGLFDNDAPILSPREVQKAVRAKVMKWQTWEAGEICPDGTLPIATSPAKVKDNTIHPALRGVSMSPRRIVSDGSFMAKAQDLHSRQNSRVPSAWGTSNMSFLAPTKDHGGAWVRRRPAKPHPPRTDLSSLGFLTPARNTSKSPRKPDSPGPGTGKNSPTEERVDRVYPSERQSAEKKAQRRNSPEMPWRVRRSRSETSSQDDGDGYEGHYLPATPPSAHATRLEAWLSTASDPFIDGAMRATISAQGSDKRSMSKLRQTDVAPVLSPRHGFEYTECVDQRQPLLAQEDNSPQALHKRTIRHINELEGSPVQIVRNTSHGMPQQRVPNDNDPHTRGHQFLESGRSSPATALKSVPLAGEDDKPPYFNIHDNAPVLQPAATSQVPEESLLPDDFEARIRVIKQQRRLTNHDDLISVLSMPMKDTRSLPAARSVRTSQSRLSVASTNDVLHDLRLEEAKYMRELRTFVDGVIPVLLSCAMSPSKSVVAATLFGSMEEGGATTPIINIGIASERLKSIHSRIPTNNLESLVLWAKGAHRVYEDYLKAWRLGFQDVVVNLTPGSAGEKGSDNVKANESGWDDGLARNANGDVVDNDGERVDVAFLMKRPLVRIKRLAKTLEIVARLHPSEQASTWSSKYNDLVEGVCTRQCEESARLEDEAAASIDGTRARDPSSLEVLSAATIISRRCVRARDVFDMKLQHSSGQRIDCRVELIIRDSSAGEGDEGDLLICEVVNSSRWLLFPPLALSMASARKGEGDGELLATIRGQGRDGADWHEVLTLRTDVRKVSAEWIEMLGGDTSVSRRASRVSVLPPSFKPTSTAHPTSSMTASTNRSVLTNKTVDFPPSERPRWFSRVLSKGAISRQDKVPGSWPEDTDNNRNEANDSSDLRQADSSRLRKIRSAAALHTSSRADLRCWPLAPDRPKDLNEAMKVAGSGALLGDAYGARCDSSVAYGHASAPSTPMAQRRAVSSLPGQATLRSAAAERYTPLGAARSPSSPLGRGHKSLTLPPTISSASGNATELQPISPSPDRTSSVPSGNAPLVPKTRSVGSAHSTPSAPTNDKRWNDSSSLRSVTLTLDHPRLPHPSTPQTAQPASRGVSSPQIGSADASPTRRQRAPSPLKRQYAPSPGSSSASHYSDDSSSDTESATSESSLDDFSRASYLRLSGSGLGSGSGAHDARRTLSATPSSVFSAKPVPSITPSQSASQARGPNYSPSGGVGLAPTALAFASARFAASIFSWSDNAGAWASLHPREVLVVVSPGLIEAFDVPARSDSDGDDTNASTSDGPPVAPPAAPLLALELTPLVPLRRGTAIDISVRSPPTPASALAARCAANPNVMFRARAAPDCDALYAAINCARIHNPTYIALHAARGAPQVPAPSQPRSKGPGAASSWWRFGVGAQRGYRKGGGRGRGDGGGGGSAVVPPSTSSCAGAPSASSAEPATDVAALKIRLYRREAAGKWRDMGAALLAVLPVASASASASAGPQQQQQQQQLRRILVAGRTAHETLLDEALPPAAFERVARTGVAVHVRESGSAFAASSLSSGPASASSFAASASTAASDESSAEPAPWTVPSTGGVGQGRGNVYMVQCASEADAAEVFARVGRGVARV